VGTFTRFMDLKMQGIMMYKVLDIDLDLESDP
jgi:hypothetical protein